MWWNLTKYTSNMLKSSTFLISEYIHKKHCQNLVYQVYQQHVQIKHYQVCHETHPIGEECFSKEFGFSCIPE